MNELKPTYSQRSKEKLELWAQTCLSDSYGSRFVIDVDVMTGDFSLTDMSTGLSVEVAENNLDRLPMGDVTDVIIPRIVRDLLIKHVETWGMQ